MDYTVDISLLEEFLEDTEPADDWDEVLLMQDWNDYLDYPELLDK